MSEVTNEKIDIKLKQVLKNFAAEITSINNEFRCPTNAGIIFLKTKLRMLKNYVMNF
jgi:hypothetical protein